ncbi:hypothetical protein BGW38_006142, partial [Lunasporangiospora selenospora]
MEAKFRRLQEQYYWNKVLAATQVLSKSTEEDGSSVDTTLTQGRFAVEDSTERLNLAQLPSDIVTMSETVPQTLSDVQVHLNRYALLYDDETDISSAKGPISLSSSDITTAAPTIRSVGQRLELEKLRLPRSYNITAKQINEISHSKIAARKRARRLPNQENRSTYETLGQLSDNALKTASSLESIDS